MPAGTAYCIPQGIAGRLLPTSISTTTASSITSGSRYATSSSIPASIGLDRGLTVAVDGEDVPTKMMGFVLRGQWIAVEKLPTIADIWWHMREMAEIYVQSRGLGAGRHRIDVDFDVSLFVHTPV